MHPGRRKRSRRNLRIDSAIWAGVIFLLEHKWSPEQIARTLTLSGITRISHETIYQRIWADKKTGGTLQHPPARPP